jgi:ribosomal protein S18 acetylase RimI-like enzyme
MALDAARRGWIPQKAGHVAPAYLRRFPRCFRIEHPRPGPQAMTAEDAVPGDAGQIVDVMRAGFDQSWLDIMLYGCAGVEHYVESQIRLGPPARNRYMVCRKDGAVVGATEFRILGETLFWNNVAVLPAEQGSRVAATLLRAMVKEARGLGLRELSLDVLASNGKALAGYERMGLRPTAERTYWRGTFPQGGSLSNYSISDHAQAEVVQARFGFSQFSVEGGGRTWKVGRLGARYFRLQGWDCASDPGLAGFLGALEPERELLALLEGAPPREVPWHPLAVAKRMTGPLEGLRV